MNFLWVYRSSAIRTSVSSLTRFYFQTNRVDDWCFNWLSFWHNGRVDILILWRHSYIQLKEYIQGSLSWPLLLGSFYEQKLYLLLWIEVVSITEIVSLAYLFILFLMMFFVVKNHFVLMQLWQRRAERDGAMMDFLCFVCFVCFTVYLLPRLM